MYVFLHLFLKRQKTDQEKENIPPKKKSQGINILNVGSANLQPSFETTPTPMDQDIDPVFRPILPVSSNQRTRTPDPETIPIDQNIDQQPVMELWKNKLNLVGFALTEKGPIGFQLLLEADTAYDSSEEKSNNHLIWVDYMGNKEQ